MIIDCHRHIWEQTKDLHDGSLGGSGPLRQWQDNETLNLAQEEGAPIRGLVDCSIVLGFVSELLGIQNNNDFVGSYVKQHSDCAVGFAGVDPTDRSSPRLVEELVKQQGFAGVVVSPGAQGFHPVDTRAMNLYAKLVELDVPVMFHYPERWVKGAHLKQARPALLDEVARNFEGLRMVITSLGWPYVDETMLMLAKHENVYSDTSIVVGQPLRLYQVISNAYQYEVMDKLLFGSGWPYCTVRAAVEALYHINEIPRQTGLPSVPREALRAIVERDSLAVLGIKHPPGMLEKQAKEDAEEVPAEDAAQSANG